MPATQASYVILSLYSVVRMQVLTVSRERYCLNMFPSLSLLSLRSIKVFQVLIQTQLCSFLGYQWFSEGVALPLLATTTAQVLVTVTARALLSYTYSAFTSLQRLSFCSQRTFQLCLISQSSFQVATIVVVQWRMTSFSVLISFHTSLVVIRPARSNRAKISPLQIRFQLSIVVLGSRSSSVKLAVVYVFIGEVSGPPAGGSAISQGLVPAPRVTLQFYIIRISTITSSVNIG